jgi:hypothetical protein
MRASAAVGLSCYKVHTPLRAGYRQAESLSYSKPLAVSRDHSLPDIYRSLPPI